MIDHYLYKEDVSHVADIDLPWEKFTNKGFVITGATGMIGSFLIDVLMYKNLNERLNCKIYALGRSRGKAEKRFETYWNSSHFSFLECDINRPIEMDDAGEVAYVLHMASNTHPVAYAMDPIGTITANIIGTNNLLDFATRHHALRFMFASSNEIYGENRGDVECFDEHYCGYIDSNTMRAGYPESKRCGEALCQAYRKQRGVEVVIPRFTRSYGPTMLMSDTKAISQFIHKAISGEDIILKSAGTQYYSYTYVADAVSGLLTVILKGMDGEAYNIADEASDIMLKDLAGILADIADRKVIFSFPDEIEKSGYSTATKARIDGSKIKKLGWRPLYDIRSGMERNIKILKTLLDTKDQ